MKETTQTLTTQLLLLVTFDTKLGDTFDEFCQKRTNVIYQNCNRIKICLVQTSLTKEIQQKIQRKKKEAIVKLKKKNDRKMCEWVSKPDLNNLLQI